MAKMKLIYICSPNQGNMFKEMIAMRQYCRRAYEKNCIPVAPHFYLLQFLDYNIPEEREFALRIGLRLIDYCSEVWVHGDRISYNMRAEIEHARATGKPIIYIRFKKDGTEEYTTECNGLEAISHVDYEEIAALVDEGAIMELRKDI